MAAKTFGVRVYKVLLFCPEGFNFGTNLEILVCLLLYSRWFQKTV